MKKNFHNIWKNFFTIYEKKFHCDEKPEICPNDILLSTRLSLFLYPENLYLDREI